MKTWMWKRLTTTPVRDLQEIKDFFDQCAQVYTEQHGNPKRLFHYRMGLIRKRAQLQTEHVVLEVGCGPGEHLLTLSDEIESGIGIDLSPKMIAVAKNIIQDSPCKNKFSFQVDNAEQLSSILDNSIDVVLCIGALEHMRDQAMVLSNIFRVLKPQGRFICLTPNGDYLWYQQLAPFLGLSTKHLSTDQFLTSVTMQKLLKQSGLKYHPIDYWTFIPKGDMHPILGGVLQMLDAIGTLLKIGRLRGGLSVCAWKPSEDVSMTHS